MLPRATATHELVSTRHAFTHAVPFMCLREVLLFYTVPTELPALYIRSSRLLGSTAVYGCLLPILDVRVRCCAVVRPGRRRLRVQCR